MHSTVIQDLEARTLEFSRKIVQFLTALANNTIISPIASQLVRSATSVGANYREANEALSKKDFLYRLKIARKECKESTYWLEVFLQFEGFDKEYISELIDESQQLRSILSSIITKAERS